MFFISSPLHHFLYDLPFSLRVTSKFLASSAFLDSNSAQAMQGENVINKILLHNHCQIQVVTCLQTGPTYQNVKLIQTYIYVIFVEAMIINAMMHGSWTLQNIILNIQISLYRI